MKKINLKIIVLILFNSFWFYQSIKTSYDYYTEQDLIENYKPVECWVLSKKCKSGKTSTTHCVVFFNAKEYFVSLYGCGDLEIGKDDKNFYYDKFTDNLIFKGYNEFK